MRRYLSTIIFAWIFSASSLSAFLIGNPAQPALFKQGVVTKNERPWSLRAAYLDDFVYSQHFKNEFKIAPLDEKPPVVQLATDAALVTLNFRRWLDLYTILGGSKLQMDQELYTRREFSWGLGTKIVMFTWESLRIGCDFKYFQTDQRPLFLVSSGLPLGIVTKDFNLNYSEYQGSLGISYEGSLICPYIQFSYLNAKVNPKPNIFLVSYPGIQEPSDATALSFIGKQRWGGAVGATLRMGTKGSFSVESRLINQNAIDASLELKF